MHYFNYGVFYELFYWNIWIFQGFKKMLIIFNVFWVSAKWCQISETKLSFELGKYLGGGKLQACVPIVAHTSISLAWHTKNLNSIIIMYVKFIFLFLIRNKILCGVFDLFSLIPCRLCFSVWIQKTLFH